MRKARDLRPCSPFLAWSKDGVIRIEPSFERGAYCPSRKNSNYLASERQLTPTDAYSTTSTGNGHSSNSERSPVEGETAGAFFRTLIRNANHWRRCWQQRRCVRR